MAPDRKVDEYASRQYGVFSLSQARTAGCTDAMVRHRVQSGAWIRLAPSVFAVASAPPRWERQVSAAVLSRPEAIVTGVTAAHLLGFADIPKGRVEIMVPATGNARSTLATVVRSVWFREMGRSRAKGFEVTDPAETILVLARQMGRDALEVVLDRQIAADDVDVEDFERIRRRISGCRARGSRRLLDLLDERSDTAWQPPTTELERHLDRLVDHPAVPPATRQHPFHLDNGPMVVDIFVPSWGLILEADGRRWHTRRADFERDRARDNAAAAHGLAVLRFTWRMLTTDLEGCRQTLLATGRARSRSA